MQSNTSSSTTKDYSSTSQTSSSIPPPPALGEGFSNSSPTTSYPAQDQAIPSTEETEQKSKKRFWQLGKKKDEKKGDTTIASSATGSALPARTVSPSARGLRSTSPQPQYAMVSPSSPGRLASTSPRLSSPAESQIFERNVQEDDSAAVVASPAIPSHIATEKHIPPVLDASSMAITDNHLTPDNVEIVTHTSHLPAAVAVSGSIHPESTLSSPIAEEVPHASLDGSEEPTPSYAALDSADIRRLSFISFADVVHGEQAADGSMRDSLLLSGASSIASPVGARSPSPIRSPISPPLNAADGATGLSFDGSPGRRIGPGSPKSLAAVSLATTSSPTVTGELAIETMRQALRKTESGDLGAAARGSISAL